MRTWRSILLITLATAVPAFALAPMIWPPNAHGAAPSGLQIPLLIALSALDALSLGLGVAFISYGLPLARRIAGASRVRTRLCFIATAWLLLSWWPHDNMHKHNGMELNGLIMIDYLFHGAMMVAGAILAYSLAQALHSAPTAGETSARWADGAGARPSGEPQ
jgi:hypothetical protein